MTRHATVMMIGLLGIFSYAQAVTCKKGIQCGNTCISASYTCHIGGPVTAPVSSPPTQVLTSPPIPAEPSGTYFGWTVIDNSAAATVLNSRSTSIPLSIGYSKQLSGLTPQEARARVDRVLSDEIPRDVVIVGRRTETGYQWLARRPDGSRGVLIFFDVQDGGILMRVSVYSASSTFDLPGFTEATRANLLALTSPDTSVTPGFTPITSPLKLFSNPDNVFLSSATGNLIAPAICVPFSFSIKPDQAFSQVTLIEEGSKDLAYSLDITVDGQPKFTQPTVLTGGATIHVPLGQQPAGTVVNFSYKPHDSSVACEGVLSIGLKVEQKIEQ